ncbi:MAG: hypothetical protein D6758_12350 [Gammaproteobacteria bacterium]|nr:MAG: hypothetical protein D6758_12350 [Gammaproteobacteria bacterium]
MAVFTVCGGGEMVCRFAGCPATIVALLATACCRHVIDLGYRTPEAVAVAGFTIAGDRHVRGRHAASFNGGRWPVAAGALLGRALELPVLVTLGTFHQAVEAIQWKGSRIVIKFSLGQTAQAG